MKAVYIKVSGIVQGVGFRYYTTRKAMDHKLTGYVKNLSDGSVEIWAEGPPHNIQGFLKEIKQGPASAMVEDIIMQDNKVKGYKNFDIKF